MRRAILAAAVIGWMTMHAEAQAGGHRATCYRDTVVTGSADANPYGPDRYRGYGRQLRGGYGVNGFAPVCGPVWGPNAFIYANGLVPDPRPMGSYVRPLYPCDPFAQDTIETTNGSPNAPYPATDSQPAK